MNDYQLCSKISEQKDKLECEKRFAKTDVNACEILSGNYKEDCLDSLENYI